MKQKMTKFLLLMLALALCLGVTACGGDTESAQSVKSAEYSMISPEDDPSEGLDGDVSEVRVKDAGLYEGFWMSEITDQYDYIVFDADGNWSLCMGVDAIDEGFLWYDQESDGTYLRSNLTGAADGGRVELDGSQLYIATLGYFNNADAGGGQGVYTGEYVGLWEYLDENLWLRIHEDATWEFVNDQEDTIYSGSLWAREDGITLYFGEGDTLELDRVENGNLIDRENNGVLVPAEGIQSSVDYFSRNGLEINAAVDAGTYWIDNGVCSYAAGGQFHSKGENYTLGGCDWEVIKNYDSTRNGIREIQFDAICYVPYSSMYDFGGALKCSVYHQLYDFYTGKWFTRIDDYKNSTRGKDYYVHTVDWNGQSGIIEFTRTSDWQSDVGEWARVVTVNYHVYLPEWYDGLVLAAEPLPDNYEDFARFDSQHRAFAEASMMDIDLLDPYGCLFFSVCY